MLKYINYQLNENTAQQVQLEHDVASSIKRTLHANMAAFKQYIPSVLDIVHRHQVQKYSVFCNAHGELNAVDFATGRVLYGEHPYQEISDEVDSFCQMAPYFDLNAEPASEQGNWQCEPLPASVDTILVFGLGMGYHLSLLLQQVRVKYIIVYEPSADYLFCSLQANDWAQLFELAASLGTQIFLQLGNDGSSLQSDLAELCEATPQHRFYLYRHYFHPMMDKVIDFAMRHSGQQQALLQGNQHFGSFDHLYDFVGERNPNVLGNVLTTDCTGVNECYEQNMAALKRFYPKVYSAIQQHQSEKWRLVSDQHNQLNLFHLERRALFYHDSGRESEQLVNYFVSHPYQDDVILGQKFSYKLRNYLHYTQMQKIQPILMRSLKKRSRLPEQINSLIIFGIGLGHQIEMLLNSHQVQNLYICEPNLDFFVASLSVLDWASLLEDADKTKRRIYLNLGGDGSRYFYDLMAQFYQVGAYSIANTYILSSYYNDRMHQAIAELRAELKVVLAIGEYFDHARYGISHSYHSLKNNFKYMKDKGDLSADLMKQLPVFVIGNGPSLDQAYPYLQEYQDKAIIISCGTALKALHSHGIRPDFHAEIEQNRATYDWVSQVNDNAYLKEIILLSVNGIHPDTARLFKDTLLCFKDGEASTYVFQSGLKKLGYPTASLAYAYPTVTNLVVNFMVKLKQPLLYLFGVDLGFVDVNYHHSKSSSYYKDNGEQIYNYQQAHGGGVLVQGNFRSQVFTKPEFDVSRKLLEQALKTAGPDIEAYNCSDGARIKGAIPLHIDNILLPNELPSKSSAIAQLVSESFYPDLTDTAELIFKMLNMEKFAQSMDEWQELLAVPPETIADVLELISKQWDFIRGLGLSEGNPAYLLFHGSTNYISAVLTKLAVSADQEQEDFMQPILEVLTNWREYLCLGSQSFLDNPFLLDEVYVHYLYGKRADGSPLV